MSMFASPLLIWLSSFEVWYETTWSCSCWNSHPNISPSYIIETHSAAGFQKTCCFMLRCTVQVDESQSSHVEKAGVWFNMWGARYIIMYEDSGEIPKMESAKKSPNILSDISCTCVHHEISGPEFDLSKRCVNFDLVKLYMSDSAVHGRQFSKSSQNFSHFVMCTFWNHMTHVSTKTSERRKRKAPSWKTHIHVVRQVLLCICITYTTAYTSERIVVQETLCNENQLSCVQFSSVRRLQL